jgi:hypothetical protein
VMAYVSSVFLRVCAEQLGQPKPLCLIASLAVKWHHIYFPHKRTSFLIKE